MQLLTNAVLKRVVVKELVSVVLGYTVYDGPSATGVYENALQWEYAQFISTVKWSTFTMLPTKQSLEYWMEAINFPMETRRALRRLWLEGQIQKRKTGSLWFRFAFWLGLIAPSDINL